MLSFMGFVTLTSSSPARAAGPLGAEGAPIRTSDYTVDLYQGPVTVSTRVIGLSGAYTAIAEGVDGLAQNPAAATVRTAWSIDSFDYDWGVGFTSASSLRGNDFYNSGLPEGELEGGEGGLMFLTPAVLFQDGPWGYGLTAQLQTFSLRRGEGAGPAQSLEAQFADVTGSIAYGFMRGEFCLGVGLRSVALSVARGASEGGEQLFVTTGMAPVLGAVYKPEGRRLRVGASFKFRVATEADPGAQIRRTPDGDLVLGSEADPDSAVWLPSELRQPWEGTLGFALSLGPRPLNPRFKDPGELLARERRLTAWRRRERARALRAASGSEAARLEATRQREDAEDEAALERAERDLRQELLQRSRSLARRYLLISSEVQLTGASNDSVGVESFVRQEVARAGEELTFSPRLGLEGEPWAHQLKLRGGSYLEPARFRRSSPRVHGTLGFDARLFEWTVFGLFDEGTSWRAGAAADLSRRYFAWSAAVGVWR
ncbi:MAG: hypothetical protein KF915_19975 [Polyangiaceae bacterium]|nr:hypothetical protein [Polyangiaceae bacterium]